ncbi:uncharacterized protein [Maniola hyperantus]|uniref:uncharacterized protein n=1 Tax=Aphantopus hyperantus TaxID=2795564 RepID=UPI0015690D31|nr:uncharacterized protein LOC117985683 [Maniola hyperantus]
MWQVVVLALSLIATANSYTSRQHRSAASESQIRFAIENKYDDTGPGAKGKEYAYKTYRTLEDALINYLDDPNTTLPQHEREKAINTLRLRNPNQFVYSSPKRPFPNAVEYNAYTKQSVPSLNLFNKPNKQTFQVSDSNYGLLDLKGFQLNDVPQNYQKERLNDGYSYQNIQSAKGIPVSVAQFTRGFQGHESRVDNQFDPNPHYSFSYGVHDKRTGDTKSAHESRADGVVRGFYSFMDADGKQRTVLYTADDKEGFKAKVQRTLRDAQE